MMLNNVLVPEENKGNITYQGPSPDEIALAVGAQKNDYILKKKNLDSVECSVLGDEIENF